MTSFLSKGTTFYAIMATMNLLLMAAIANDGGTGTNNNLPGSSSSSRMLSTIHPTTSTNHHSGGSTSTSTHNPSSVRSMMLTTLSSSLSSSTTTTRMLTTTTSRSTVTTTTQSTQSTAGRPPTPAYLVKEKSYEGLKGDRSTSSSTENSSISSLFVTENATVVTSQIRSNALIPCIVSSRHSGDTVSWIRRKDYHLLTVGLQAYTNDERFSAIHAQSPEDWTLKIKYVQERDAGWYQCQVATHPPTSIFLLLQVVESRAEIAGGPDKYIKSGSSLRLVCELKQSTEEPDYVFWYQGLKMINYDPVRRVEVTHDKYSSTLVLHNAKPSDSGNYTCVPSNSIPGSITVHILNGENPAAMQHGSHTTSCVPCPPLWLLSVLLSIILQTLYFQCLTTHHAPHAPHSPHHQQHHHLLQNDEDEGEESSSSSSSSSMDRRKKRRKCATMDILNGGCCRQWSTSLSTETHSISSCLLKR